MLILHAAVLVAGSSAVVLACLRLHGWKLRAAAGIRGAGGISRISRFVFWRSPAKE